jgi:hypothetical protein
MHWRKHSSETLVYIHQITWSHIPEDGTFHSDFCENLWCHTSSSSAFMIKVGGSFETLVLIYQATRCHILEDCNHMTSIPFYRNKLRNILQKTSPGSQFACSAWGHFCRLQRNVNLRNAYARILFHKTECRAVITCHVRSERVKTIKEQKAFTVLVTHEFLPFLERCTENIHQEPRILTYHRKYNNKRHILNL